MKSVTRFYSLLLVTAALTSVSYGNVFQKSDKKNLDTLEERAFKQAAALVSPSVVRIQTVGGRDIVGKVLTPTGPTTGVVVSKDGYIISSAFNFVSSPASVLVELPDERRLPARIVATDRSKMLTLIKIDVSGLIPATPAEKKSVKIGQWAIAMGRTYNNDIPNISIGIVSALDRIWGKALQTDAKVSPVNYGGPLVDIHGKVMGILVPLSTRGKGATAGVEWYDSGIGFAIPMQDVYTAIERLKKGNDLHPGLMGLYFKGSGLLAGDAMIDRVRLDSPAANAGLKRGDLFVEIDGRKIIRQADVRHAIGGKYAGDTITVKVRRKDLIIEKKLTLIDKLRPYKSGFLGLLPTRVGTDDGKQPGVGVRSVFAESPAARVGLSPRDRITKFDGKVVQTATELLNLVSRMRPTTKTSIEFLSEGAKKTANIELAAIPDLVPVELPSVSIVPPKKKPEGVKVDRFQERLKKYEHDYWAYVPEDYNPSFQYSLLVWLHPKNDTMEADMLDLWKTICRHRGIILLAPKAKTGAWNPNESGFVKDLVDRFMQDYSIDPKRVVLHSYAESAQFAFQLAFQFRALFKGVAVASAPVRKLPQENNPEFRLQFYLSCGEQDPVLKDVKKSVERLRKMEYPLVMTTIPDEKHDYPSVDILLEIARWIDSLDRI